MNRSRRRTDSPSPSSHRRPHPLPQQPLHFFIIMLYSPSVNEHKMMLPAKFTRKLGNELSAVAKLVVPSGQCWQVRLEKADNKIWFKRGWQEFVKFYSICYGNLLVFRYEGESTFHVCIMDRTLTEIDYPLNGPSSNTVDPNLDKQPKEKPDDTNDNEINLQIPHSSSKRIAANKLGDKQVFNRDQNPFSSNPKTGRSNKNFRTNSPSIDSPNASGGVKTEEGTPVEQPGHVNVPRSSGKLKEDENCFPHDLQEQNHEVNTNLILPRGFPVTNSKFFKISKETEKIANIASKREYENPSFMVILRKRNSLSKSVHVPAIYAEKHMNQCSGFIDLMVHGNETQKWRIQCLPRSDLPSCRELSHGWSKFAVDNNLKEGDVCVFEVVEKGENIVLKVWIYCAGWPVEKRLNQMV
ncbi:B3 domain-containing transcription factor VRN1-like [Humulus lupulus]|uniref:B3 domain-containing transcription factor VRN1-like n=1 Tax=Humulus lupulus TaxID=3486 RepID=UPI002B40D699|nr:B3 domain-containing transcription factor VRN1-like [Humulus lupulus]